MSRHSCVPVFLTQNTAEMHAGTGFAAQIHEIDCNYFSALLIGITNNKTLKKHKYKQCSS
jgi:hypothetical protein